MRISKTQIYNKSFCGIPTSKVKSAKVIGQTKENNLQQSNDGSFYIDNKTGTKIFYGSEASEYLENHQKFENNTEIIAQSNTKIKVTCDEGSYILDEPGAIMIEGGRECNIKILEGSPFVVEYSSTPSWYKELKPYNEHEQYFSKMARKNHELYICDKHEIASSHQNQGEVREEDFAKCPSWVYSKLFNNKMILTNNDGKNIWGGFWDNNNFQRDLYEQTGIYGQTKDDVLQVWQKTTKSGYDISGLKQSYNGITIYTHKDKFNQNNHNPTEWITNSTAWTPNGPFMVGVSRVISTNSKEARAFNSIRAAESVHKHQQVDDPSHLLTEAYILTQGDAVIFSIEDGKPKYHEVKEGDMLVMAPGVIHGVVAASGDYEHLCTQSPSVFQYGLNFKNVIRPFEENDREIALKKLREQEKFKKEVQKNTKETSIDKLLQGEF